MVCCRRARATTPMLRWTAAGALKLAHKILNRNVLYTCLGAEAWPVLDFGGPHKLQQNDRLLLCSDGLWDVLQEHTLLQRLSNSPVQDAVPALVDAALQVASSKSDNVTAIAVQWEQAQPEPEAIDTQHGGEDTFSSTIQSLQDLEGFDVNLDEAEIERSIAEINEAIRRSALHKKV